MSISKVATLGCYALAACSHCAPQHFPHTSPRVPVAGHGGRRFCILQEPMLTSGRTRHPPL
eukprot:384154-Alexandrium_andersonii.AAC.1